MAEEFWDTYNAMVEMGTSLPYDPLKQGPETWIAGPDGLIHIKGHSCELYCHQKWVLNLLPVVDNLEEDDEFCPECVSKSRLDRNILDGYRIGDPICVYAVHLIKEIGFAVYENHHLKCMLAEMQWITTRNLPACNFCGNTKRTGHKEDCRLHRFAFNSNWRKWRGHDLRSKVD